MTQEQLHMLLAAGMQHGASDIHLKVGDPPTYRVNGTLAPLKYERLKPADTLAIRQHIIRHPEVKERPPSNQAY